LGVAAAAVVGLVLVSALLFQWSLEKAALLAPLIVATAGATAFIFVLWAKIAWEGLRRSEHPVAITVGIVGTLVLLVVLSFFVDLPAYH
jgi:predicted N-acetyltransferase YhbS